MDKKITKELIKYRICYLLINRDPSESVSDIADKLLRMLEEEFEYRIETE